MYYRRNRRNKINLIANYVSSSLKGKRLAVNANYKIRFLNYRFQISKTKDDNFEETIEEKQISEGLEKYKRVYNNVISILLAVAVVVAFMYSCFEKCSICQQQMSRINSLDFRRSVQKLKKFWIYGTKDINKGHVDAMLTTFQRYGYENAPHWEYWDLLWAWQDPFVVAYPDLKDMHDFQRVNHFPGFNRLFLDKNVFADSRLEYVPRTFKIPRDTGEFLMYAKDNPEKTFIWKDHQNLTVLKAVSEVGEELNTSLVQELITKPYLISGRVFDIGVFAVITSVDPLRIYVYNADIAFRSAMEEFNPLYNDTNEYIASIDGLVGDVLHLRYIYEDLDFNSKESVNWHIRRTGQDPNGIWEEAEDAIRKFIIGKEAEILKELKRFKSPRNFFEMLRFNFIIDEDLHVHIISIQPVPNLKKQLFHWNQLLEEKVLHHFLGLVGVAPKMDNHTLNMPITQTRMESSVYNLAVFPQECTSLDCLACDTDVCSLCLVCEDDNIRAYLLRAYSEQLNKGECKRIYPIAMNYSNPQLPADFSTLSRANRMMHLWYQGMCMWNTAWCK